MRPRSYCALFLLALLAAPPWAGPRAAAADDALASLEEPGQRLLVQAGLVVEKRKALFASEFVTTAQGVSVVSRDLPEGREQLRAQVHEKLVRGAAALREMGFAAAKDVPSVMVVRVRVERGLPLVAVGEGGSAIVERIVGRPRNTRLPEAPHRDDGHPMIRDVTRGTDQLRLHAWTRSSSLPRGPGSLDHALARHLVNAAKLPDATPRWARVGLVDRLQGRIDPASDAAGSAHLCAHALALDAARFAPLLAPDSRPTAPEQEALGRLVGALVDGKTDVPARFAKLAAGAAAPASVQAAFGVSLDAALTEAREGLSASEGPCDAKTGGIPCMLCGTDGELIVSCENCSGLGKVLCTACGGNDLCPARYCYSGKQHWPGDYDSLPCKFCSKKGRTKCLACSGKHAKPCKECKGSGKSKRPCLACKGGRFPCPEAGRDAAVDRGRFRGGESGCSWCRDEGLNSACGTCFGVGYSGCEVCEGTTRLLCQTCKGHGCGFWEYRGRTLPSSYSKCSSCKGKGFRKCGACSNGKFRCNGCKGKGVEVYRKADCAACGGDGLQPCAGEILAGGRVLAEGETEATSKATERAVNYLLGCTSGGGFAVTYLRGSRTGKLAKPSLFSNSYVLWALASAGVKMEHPRVSSAWKMLREQMKSVLSGRDDDPTTQSVAIGLRALVLGGEDPEGPLIPAVIKLLEKHQRRNGFWHEDLYAEEDGNAYTSLYAIESLWMAHTKGAKVSGQTWRKAYQAANRSIKVSGPADMMKKGSFVTATRVASNTALVILAKAGTLGKKSGTFDYGSIKAVRGGLAWLDRYWNIAEQPVFKSGARRRANRDAGYGVYLFSMQRLGMLLEIDELGGERWYPKGAAELRARQHEDGSIRERGSRPLNDPVVMTVAGVLFLVRATSPVTGGD
jgi:hypothetical protein